jgi:hypothetical protein
LDVDVKGIGCGAASLGVVLQQRLDLKQVALAVEAKVVWRMSVH